MGDHGTEGGGRPPLSRVGHPAPTGSSSFRSASRPTPSFRTPLLESVQFSRPETRERPLEDETRPGTSPPAREVTWDVRRTVARLSPFVPAPVFLRTLVDVGDDRKPNRDGRMRRGPDPVPGISCQSQWHTTCNSLSAIPPSYCPKVYGRHTGARSGNRRVSVEDLHIVPLLV